MKKWPKRYAPAAFLFLALLLFTLFDRKLGTRALQNTGHSLKQMLLLLPPVFLLLGLLDVWVPKEIMMKYMGNSSGIKGVILAFLLGSFASGPLYAAFPAAAVFMKKGVKFSNILIFLGAWSTTKIPMLIFQASNLGWKFTLVKLLVDIPGIIIMAVLIRSMLSKKELDAIYENAGTME